MRSNACKKLAVAALLCLVLGGVLAAGGLGLARGGGGAGDRFVGVQLAYEYVEMGAGKWSDYAWQTDDGQPVTDDPFGTASKEGLIVEGVWNEAEMRYDFPGVKGYNCFVARTEDSWRGHTDLYGSRLSIGDEGCSLEGTVYFGLESEAFRSGKSAGSHHVWTPYPVYQRPDGSVYLRGGVTGGYGPSGGITVTERQEGFVPVDGAWQYVEVSCGFEWIERVTHLEVVQFDDDDRLLCREKVPVEGERMRVKLDEGAVWVLVREMTGDDPGEEALYTMADRTEFGSIHHSFIALDEAGMGYPAKLILEEKEDGDEKL